MLSRSLLSESMTTPFSEVLQSGGMELSRTLPYLLVTIRESKIATTPLSSTERIKRPVPWASNNAARGRETCIKPLPPAASACEARALITGSSGRGNGMRSMAPRCNCSPEHQHPATATLFRSTQMSHPWQSDRPMDQQHRRAFV